MKIGRNEPCPCGSGKKYKKCCLRSGKFEADRSDPALAAARSYEEWEMAILPISANLGEGPHSRPTVVLVTAGPAVVYSDLLTELSVEIPDLADEMVRHLTRAVERTGARPEALLIDEWEVEDELATRMVGPLEGIEVDWSMTRNAYEAWRSMSEHVFGSQAQDVVVTATWGSWQQPEGWVRAMFAAAERYYRCRPWKYLDGDEDLVDVELVGSPAMSASVMGAAGQTQGLALTTSGESFFSDLELIRILPGRKIMSEILALSFASLSDLPPEARREVRKLKLPLAGPTAYPMLHVMGGRAGGLPRDRAERLLAVLEAFVECFEQEGGPADLVAGEGWQSADGSVRFVMPPKRERLDEWPGEVDSDHLESGRTLGSGADWRACRPFVDDGSEEGLFHVEALLRSFRSSLENQGLAETTVKKHLANAEHLFEYLAGWAGVRPEALHEFDLRTFLYDWYPHKAGASQTEARSIHASLEKLFARLEDELDLEFPWAPRLLRERDTFRTRWETNEPGPFWDPDVQAWRSVLSAHLDALAMLPRNQLGDDESWGDRMGRQELALYDELARRWLHWRDDAIDRGVTARDELVPLLSRLQRTWETSPHERSGRAPYDVIVEERREIAAKLAESRETPQF